MYAYSVTVALARYDLVTPHQMVVETGASAHTASELMTLAGDLAGKRVLDVACGVGYLTRKLARRGAMAVGIDISERLIDYARRIESEELLGIQYIVGDISASRLPHDDFDLAFCHFGFSDIDNLSKTLANIHASLHKGGKFYFLLLHPCFPGVPMTASSWPLTGRYCDEGWWLPRETRSPLRQVVGMNHRMLSTYVNSLIEAGFRLDRLEEPLAEPSWAATRPGVSRYPIYLSGGCSVDPSAK